MAQPVVNNAFSNIDTDLMDFVDVNDLDELDSDPFFNSLNQLNQPSNLLPRNTISPVATDAEDSFQLSPQLAWQAIVDNVQTDRSANVQYTSKIQGGLNSITRTNVSNASQTWQQQVSVQELITSGHVQFALNQASLLDYNRNGSIGDSSVERAGITFLLDAVSNNGKVTGVIRNVPQTLRTTVSLLTNARTQPQFVSTALAIRQKLATYI